MPDAPACLPPHQSSQHPCARIQRKGQYQYPIELAINGEIDRFSLAIDVIDRTAKLQTIGALGTLFEFQDLVCTIESPRLIIDLSEVPYMDSAGFGAVLRAYSSCQPQYESVEAAEGQWGGTAGSA